MNRERDPNRSIEEIIDKIRSAIISADNSVIGTANDVSEPTERDDLVGRTEYLSEISRLAGIREGLKIARVALEQQVKIENNIID